MELENRKVLILGLGRTGESLARFLLGRRARVTISEKKQEEELGLRKILTLKERGVSLETGGHNLQTFLAADLIIPSPGVPPLPELESARKSGIPVISEIELACRFLKGTIVGITGSNGKSTTTTLIHRILKGAGLHAYLAGNIGTPLISFAEKSRAGNIYVTEISSFQLEYIQDFRVPLAAVLNISINHLDWHPSFSDYWNAKKKLILFQKSGDVAVLNRDDPLVWELAKEAKSEVYAFSRKRRIGKGCFVRAGEIFIRNTPEEKLLKLDEIPLPGAHNQENCLAAACIAHLLGVPARQTAKGIRNFKGLEHRLEKVITLRGIEFINDSKATTVDAALKALASVPQKIILILGGRDKGDDFTRLRKSARRRVKRAILIGEARPKIENALQGYVPLASADSLREAVAAAFAAASPGEAVLLAPACTSFDMFRNFEHRGRVFKREVLHLRETLGKKK
jgi:UDP-N-acetylmuramoylalanine--D-glutamate ligase